MKKTTRPAQTYHWQGIDKNGHYQQGLISAETTFLAKTKLQSRGCSRVKVQSIHLNQRFHSAIPREIFNQWYSQLADLLEAGIPLLQALKTLAENMRHRHLKIITHQLYMKVAQGASFAEALKAYPKHFTSLARTMVLVGEETGQLGQLLKNFATYQQAEHARARQFKKALLYPFIVLIAAVLATILMLVFVVPKFTRMFENLDATLPMITQWVIKISLWLQTHGMSIFISFGLITLLGGLLVKKWRKARWLFSYAFLKLPLIGRLQILQFYANTCTILGFSLTAGIPLLKALEMNAQQIKCLPLQNAWVTLINRVQKGCLLSVAFTHFPYSQSFLKQMVQIGEQTGSLHSMFSQAGHYFQSNLKNLSEKLTALIEPLMITLLGLIVGGLILAMYLPIFQLGQAV